MESETSKPNNELADPKKIEFWAAITRGLAGIWVIVFIGAVGGVVLGFIDDNKFPLVPFYSFLIHILSRCASWLAGEGKKGD